MSRAKVQSLDMPIITKMSALINPTARQREFLVAFWNNFKYILYGGAAGGGKSYILRWSALLFLIKAFFLFGVKNCVVGIFCEDFPQLQKRQLAKIEVEFPKWLGEMRRDDKLGLHYRLRDEFGGGIIFLCNLDEPSKYDSVEFAAVFVDEFTKNKLQQDDDHNVFEELRKRLRWPIKPGEPSFPAGFVHPFVATSNPGGKGHGFVKRLWIDRDFPENLQPYAKQFIYIPAKVEDNPYNPPSYVDTLRSLPALMRKAYLEGSWDLFVGQYFSEFRRDLHVIKPINLKPYWKRWCAKDWGFGSYACNLWFAAAPDDTVYITKEYYDKGRVASLVGKKLVAMNGDEKLAYKFLDPAAWADQHNGMPIVSVASELANVGWDCVEANNDRVSGWNRVREYLAWEQDERSGLYIKRPKLYIFDTCKNLIRTLPTLIFDENNPEDLDTDGEDHAADALRYGVNSEPPSTNVPFDSMTEEWREAALRAERFQKQKGK